MSESISLGLIGCGSMGTFLAQAAQATGLARLGVVFDTDPAKAVALAQTLDCTAARSEEELLAWPGLQAVVVATPPFAHTETVIRAAQAGKQVFVEKPMALCTADCDRMLAAAEQAGVTLMVGQVLRYYEPFRTILRWAGEGRLGRPLAAAIWRVGDGGYIRLTPWRRWLKNTGGYLYEVGVHELDFMRCLLGEALAVQALLQKRVPAEHEVEDVISVQMQFETAIGTYLGGTVFPRNDYGFTLRFEQMTLHSEVGFDPNRLRAEDTAGTPVELPATTFASGSPVEAEMGDWLKSLLASSPVPIPGQEGRNNIALIDAAYASAASRQTVRLAQADVL